MSVRTALAADPLLGAAFDSFARYGFKRTTMADVAAGAGMSRPAVYLRVANKDELLCQVAAALLADSLERARAAAAANAPAAARLDGVLQAKLDMTLDLAAHSAHAVELLDAYHRLAAAESVSYIAEVRELAAGVLRDAGADPARCADLAAALIAAVVGLEAELGEPGTARRLLTELATTTVAGL